MEKYTPHDKATNLINQFKEFSCWQNEKGISRSGCNRENAKKCAIIYVEGLIEQLNDLRGFTETLIKINYWEQVLNDLNHRK